MQNDYISFYSPDVHSKLIQWWKARYGENNINYQLLTEALKIYQMASAVETTTSVNLAAYLYPFLESEWMMYCQEMDENKSLTSA